MVDVIVGPPTHVPGPQDMVAGDVFMLRPRGTQPDEWAYYVVMEKKGYEFDPKVVGDISAPGALATMALLPSPEKAVQLVTFHFSWGNDWSQYAGYEYVGKLRSVHVSREGG